MRGVLADLAAEFSRGHHPEPGLCRARNPEGKGKIPNITPSHDGLGDWSTDDITYLLETGNTPDFDVIGGVMAPVQENMAVQAGRSFCHRCLSEIAASATDAVPKKKKATGEDETDEEKEGDGSGGETSDGGSKQPDGAE